MTKFNENRTYGVELEVLFSGTRQDLANAINQEFASQNIFASAYDAGYTHADNNQNIWKVVHDGSVRNGWEVVSPILKGFEGKAQIDAVCKALQNVGCDTNRTTGMHVHHHALDLTPKQIGQAFGTYAAFQTLLDYSVSPSRRGFQTYTTPVPTTVTNNGDDKWDDVQTRPQAIRKLDTTKSSSRYSAMNHDSLRQGSRQYHGTIEFRQHQGTTNATKIWTWILVTQSIIENGVQNKARFPKTLTSEMQNGKMHAKGDFVRFKNFIGITAETNDGDAEASEPYMWAYKQMRKTIKKFTQRANLEIDNIGR